MLERVNGFTLCSFGVNGRILSVASTGVNRIEDFDMRDGADEKLSIERDIDNDGRRLDFAGLFGGVDQSSSEESIDGRGSIVESRIKTGRSSSVYARRVYKDVARIFSAPDDSSISNIIFRKQLQRYDCSSGDFRMSLDQ